MMAVVGISFCFISSAVAKADWASKEKGWHKGTYVLLGLGFLNVDKDTNVNTNQAFGSNIILGTGLTFGWNFLDNWAAELQMRYGTEVASGQREHAANININAKYSLILDSLTRMENLRFLPYAKVGGGIFGAAVPDITAGNDRLGVFGPTFDFGVGMEMLFYKLWYFAVDFTQDFAFLQDKSKGGQKILNGGFDPQSSVYAYVGIHF